MSPDLLGYVEIFDFQYLFLNFEKPSILCLDIFSPLCFSCSTVSAIMCWMGRWKALPFGSQEAQDSQAARRHLSARDLLVLLQKG